MMISSRLPSQIQRQSCQLLVLQQSGRRMQPGTGRRPFSICPTWRHDPESHRHHHKDHDHHSESSTTSTLFPPWLLGLGIGMGAVGVAWSMIAHRQQIQSTGGTITSRRIAVLDDGLLQLAVDVQEGQVVSSSPKLVSSSVVPAAAAKDTGPASEHNPTPTHTPPHSVKTTAIPHVEYVLIGSGTASYHAAQAIRSIHPEADILIIGAESHLPYARPPLSKELWFIAKEAKKSGAKESDDLSFTDWQGNQRDLYYAPKEKYQIVGRSKMDMKSPKTKFLPGTVVSKLSPESQTIQLKDGELLRYGKVLLATGGSPKWIPAFDALPQQARSQVMVYRNIDDFRRLMSAAKPGQTIAIVGGGFLGSELAAALSTQACTTIQIYPEEGNMSNVFPKYLTHWTRRAISALGVDVKAGSSISSVSYGPDEGKILLGLQPAGTLADDVPSSTEQVAADVVVVAAGLEPNVAIANQSRLEIDPVAGGILVNAELEARANVFAAGDVTSYYDVVLGRRRVEHYDHAAYSGRQAGENMAGQKRTYTHLPMFWSDLGPKISYEACGLVSSKYKTVSIWAKPKGSAPSEDYQKGVVYYLSPDQEIVGVLLWNAPGRMEEARALLRQHRRVAHPRDLTNLMKL